MGSKSRRRRVDVEEAMDVDDDSGGEYTKDHQIFLQYVIHARMSSKMELAKVHGKLFNDRESLSDTLSMITKKINPLKMDVKEVKSDITGATYFVLIQTTDESFFARCCIFNKAQTDFLKQIITGIVLAPDGCLGKIQALNICQTLSKTQADEAIRLFIKEKVLIERIRGGLCMSPWAVVEFEPFFHTSLRDHLSICDLCKQLVFVGKVCEGPDCGLKFHLHCVSKWVENKHYECPQCQQVWPSDMQADTE